MRLAVRSIGVALLVITAAVLLAVTQTTTTAFTLAATTALISTWWGDPLSTPPDSVASVQAVMGLAVNNYIAPASTANTPHPTGIPTGPYNTVALIGISPAQAGGVTEDQTVLANQKNLDNCIQGSGCMYNMSVGSTAPQPYAPGPPVQPGDTFIVGAYSEATVWATAEKRALAAQYPTPGTGPQVTFMLLSNLNRPNGGTLARGPEGSYNALVGITNNGSTPTNTQYPTVDITRQYDGASDAPLNPLNPWAEANAFMGFVLLHGQYNGFGLQPGGGALLQDQYGDTTYYMIPTTTLPLLVPLSNIPGIGFGLADMMDPTLRVLVESGYDRTISPGQPTPYNYSYFPNLTTFFNNLNLANQTGMDNLSQDLGMGRPLGTTRPDISGQGAYGVGGPPVTMNPQTTATTMAAAQPALSPSPQVTSPLSAAASTAPAPSLPVPVPVPVPKPTTPSISSIVMTGGNKVSPGASTSSTSSPGGANPVQQVLGSVSSALSGLAGGLTNGAQKATTTTPTGASGSSGSPGPSH
jgi:hypothetical protein